MNSSNEAIAKRINKELKTRDWSQIELLRRIEEYKNPNINKVMMSSVVAKNKGNFSAALKGHRSIAKEDLFIISKIFCLPLEYIWFGEDQKSEFVPSGARFAAYQDSEMEYRSYIAGLEYVDKIQYAGESGFNLFDYLGQYESINGYRFFVENYNLCFNYDRWRKLVFINSEGQCCFCSLKDKDYLATGNLLRTLVKYKDVKTFKKIFFDSALIDRFDPNGYYNNQNPYFDDDFLEILLQNEQFLDFVLKVGEVDLHSFNNRYQKGEIRYYVEPMFFEALSFALKNENTYYGQLLKMLRFAIAFNRKQHIFVEEFLKKHNERLDARVDKYDTKSLISDLGYPLGNIITIKEKTTNDEVNKLIDEIERLVFNMTHIINEQEKQDGEIKISTPDNPLFDELQRNAKEQRLPYIPTIVHANDEYTYFAKYESEGIKYTDIEQLQFVIDCLNKAQNLVSNKEGCVLVHGNLNSRVIMKTNGVIEGLAEWHKCHYGNKYEDRVMLLLNASINIYVRNNEIFKKAFDVISQGFDIDERFTLIDKTIDVLKERIALGLKENDYNESRIEYLAEALQKLEVHKIYLQK